MEIKYQGAWLAVRERGWTETDSNAICGLLTCGGGRTAGPRQFPRGSAGFLPKAVRCPPKASHLAECFSGSVGGASGQGAVMLVCDGEGILRVPVHQPVQLLLISLSV